MSKDTKQTTNTRLVCTQWKTKYGAWMFELQHWNNTELDRSDLNTTLHTLNKACGQTRECMAWAHLKPHVHKKTRQHMSCHKTKNKSDWSDRTPRFAHKTKHVDERVQGLSTLQAACTHKDNMIHECQDPVRKPRINQNEMTEPWHTMYNPDTCVSLHQIVIN